MPERNWGFVYPKHVLDVEDGKAAHDAFLLNPVGTGPYKVESFSPNDQVIYVINENYREPNKPYFERVNLKGGGDAASAARAVLQTGDYDYAWNLQVEPQILAELEQGGKGVFVDRARHLRRAHQDPVRRPEHRGRRGAGRAGDRQPDHRRQGGPPGAQPGRAARRHLAPSSTPARSSSRRPPTSWPASRRWNLPTPPGSSTSRRRSGSWTRPAGRWRATSAPRTASS